ncbi:MAG: retroviral-like aspartic protease family protein, partial [Candidatus Thermoplasmatota archaeon]
FHLNDPGKTRELEMLVDTGASRTVIPRDVVDELGLRPEKRQKFTLADGTQITRDVAWIGIEHGGDSVHSLAILGEPGDSPVLGAITLEDLVLQVDPVAKVLRPAEQFLLATAGSPVARGKGSTGPVKA